MSTAYALAWILFCLALAGSLGGVLWASRRNWFERADYERVDWKRFMRELEAWSADRARVGRQPFDDA
jgi:hypothetical protein